MAQHSYQDLDVRLKALEELVNFIASTFTVTKQYRSILAPDQVIRESKTLLEVYREVKSMNAQIIPLAPDAPMIDGEVVKADAAS